MKGDYMIMVNFGLFYKILEILSMHGVHFMEEKAAPNDPASIT
jgi:hypothetical protein